jgi:ribosomal protein S18 acetylase RimI-like enzyme
VRIVNCLCGKRIEAADESAIAAAFWSHTDGEHADIKISDARRTDLNEALGRSGGWDGEREHIDVPIEVRPLTPAMKQQYLAYFDGPAFCDNPVWARCYCLSYHLGEELETSDARTAAANRAQRATQIERGDASGVLAFAGDRGGSGDRVVGWCNASPRTTLPLLDRYFPSDDPEHTGSIVCYVIAPRFRGQGIARKLLDGAEEMLRGRGFRWIEAYPPKDARTDAGSYHGKLNMYVDAGFEQVRESGRYVVVRKAL